jgi:dipeptidyl aminopeptidase/acylaminoacyl peptidase
MPDGSGLIVTTDDDGRGPIVHIDLATDTVTRVTSDDAAFASVAVSPDGRVAYALRSSYEAPATPVRIDLAAALGTGEPVASGELLSPVPTPALPGTLAEIEISADVSPAGARVRAWLVLPEGAGPDNPAPLLLWVHGGPLSSWNAWSWRWNPWILAAQGYAVLLPDPALSTGYGLDFIARGWGNWGGTPFEDIMAITDAAVARPDIDETRTGMMGGSFGGYMANWIAGHTDRFRAIVSHASLWDLGRFGSTTDDASYWDRELSPAMQQENSPHLSAGDIRTPMLVVHGDRDYRVPIGEGIDLWWSLLSESGLPETADSESPHRFLYFPNENHWVLKPQHAKIWYQVVESFLAEHVLGLTGDALPPLPPELG